MANILVVGFTPKGLRYRLRTVPKVIRSVKKAIELLDLFTEERPEWGVTELAQALGLPKATVHGLLCSLVEGGVLHRLPSGRYRLGWRIPLLNRVLMESVPLRLEARPRMARLAELYGETVHLAVLERGRVLYLEKQQGNRAIQVNITGVGAYLYAHASALGKVLLSGLSEKEVIAVVRTHGLPALTPNTITTLEELLSELRGVRERGYAYDLEEYLPDLCCVAATIRDHTGEVIAALSFSVPKYRFLEMKQAYRNVIVEAAKEISEALGYEEARGRRGYVRKG
ncbi:MAG TPA: IclR family transcriptional regulator [Thermus scotoductus]|jgi:DNA-binding IclR family transcriptional regulator|nr:IclR family transcriptional regulator [Thermus scotoductus]